MSGTTTGENAVVAMANPSTADSTEMAGVMTPSPMRRDAPNRPSSTRRRMRVRTVAASPSRARMASASSDSTPPSPSLSARMTKTRYLIETTKVIDQNTRESTPRMFS